jgi:hypothetical protein
MKEVLKSISGALAATTGSEVNEEALAKAIQQAVSEVGKSLELPSDVRLSGVEADPNGRGATITFLVPLKIILKFK